MSKVDYKTIIDSKLAEWKNCSETPYHGLEESMAYSLNLGGKRIRPLLVLEFCRVTGGEFERAIDAACAIEMIHTYSLIHDDLPCMDDDDFRRGKPSNHIVYGEATATIAGDALQSQAFITILKSQSISHETAYRCVLELAEAAGCDGMCGGQYLDTVCDNEEKTVNKLDYINSLKTGALLSAACRIGAVIGGADEELINAAGLFGHYLGLAFQIRDDVLDVIGEKDVLGKNIGSDDTEGKTTYMSLLGQNRCMEIVTDLTNKAINILRDNFKNTEFLEKLALELVNREK